MNTFIAVCLGLITLELGVLIVVLIAALLKIRQAAQAVEVLSYRLEEGVGEISSTLSSGWLKILPAAATFLGGWWSGRKRG